MFNDRNKNWFRLAWHPPDDELLAFLDGELNAKLATRVQKHLEGCWGCRAKREKIERSISAFINYRNTVLDEAGASQATAHKRFSDKLSGLIADRTEMPPDLFRLEVPVRPSSYYFLRVTVAAVVVVLFIAAGIWFGGERTVSATELLERAAQAEINKLNQAHPVVHRKLRCVAARLASSKRSAGRCGATVSTSALRSGLSVIRPTIVELERILTANK
jgi:anti-sigma factor RsiW